MLAFLRLTLSSRGAFCITCLILKLCVRYDVNGCEIRTTTRIPTIEFSQTGTLTIGIIASLHEYEAKVLCSSKIKHLSSLQMIESIVFAINEINAKRLVHPNVTLGFKIVDDCSNGITAMAKALHLMHNCSHSPTSQKNDVVAVILTDSSPITLRIAALFSSLKVPQISFRASAITLDEQRKYSYFFRTIPNSAMQVQVIVDILLKFQWSYVSIVYVDNIYGNLLFEGIGKLLSQIGYCFAVVRKIHPESKQSTYVEAATALSADPNATVVIVALSMNEAKQLFKVFADNWRGNRTWIAAETIGPKVDELIDVKHVVSGMLAVTYDSCHVPRFDHFFKYLNIKNGSRNPWFRKFFHSAFDFRLHQNVSSFMQHVPIMQSPHYKPEKIISRSIDAVYAIAYSLKAVLEECSNVTASPHQCVDGTKLRDALSKVNFQGELVNINFNLNGSGNNNYKINNIYIENGELIERKVGLWNTSLRSFTFFDMDNVIWSWTLSKLNVTKKRWKMHPVSMCSKPCPAGFTRVYKDRCCWKCFPCQKNERTIIVKNMHFCDICPTVYNFTWPDKYTRRKCLPILATFDDLSGWVGPCLFSFNILVLLSALIVAILYVINRNRRIIKASSREISLMMLGGHVIVCLCATTHFIRPYIVTCALKHFWFPMSFSVTYGPLLVKTNRIYRIFITKQMTTERPPLISSQAQIFLVLIIIGIQIMLSGLDLVLFPPRVTFIMPSIYEKYVEQVCSIRRNSYYLSLFYIFLLIIGCVVHAYNVRNLPTNYNEAKFIIISMYCFGILWIGVITGFFTSESRIIQNRWLIAFMLTNMLVSQAFLLYPKLFAIYHDNIGTTTSFKNRSLFSEFASLRPPSHR